MGHNVYARISAILSLVSLAVFYLYGGLHTHLMKTELFHSPELISGKGAWLTWRLVGTIHLASEILAVAAFIIAVVSFKERPRRLYPMALALFALCISFLIMV